MITDQAIRNLLMAALVLAIAGCGGDDDSMATVPEGIRASEGELGDAFPYRAETGYSGDLIECVSAQELAQSCRLERLPLLGMEFDQPTEGQVMERVVVSHQWMGERFEQLLAALPADMLTLLKGVTAIVIDDDIRPSYYNTLSGAIYLDPALLWLTNAEKATISKKEDYRNNFDNQLAFRSFWRYVDGVEDIHQRGSLNDATERTFDDILHPMAALLFHELAHANDFFQPNAIDTLDRTLRIQEAADALADTRIAERLEDYAGLNSLTLYDLAQVMFRGKTPSETQKAMTAEEVGVLFDEDRANDDYGYSSKFEDVAMLFEEAMMKYHFNIDRDLAFTSVAEVANNCNGYVVGWGVSNRVADEDVRDRAQFVVGELLPPSAALDLFFQNMEPPKTIDAGQGWCDSIDSVPDRFAESDRPGANLRIEREPDFDPNQWLRHE